MSSSTKPFFEVRGTILQAKVVGFYKIKGFAANKMGLCRHVSCGSVAPTRCHYLIAKADYEELVTTGMKYSRPVKKDELNYEKNYVANLYETHKTCDKDWCSAWRPKPAGCNVPVKCTRLHLESYTDQELANPGVKPESVAINVTVALISDSATARGIALYDLMEDKWFKDTWWTTTGYMSTKLMPHKQANWPAPKELALMDQVLIALKAQL